MKEIYKVNNLIEAKIILEGMQKDIIDIILNKIKPDDELTYEINVSEFVDVYENEGEIYKNIRKATKLFDKRINVLINNSNVNRKIDYSWFSKIEYVDKEGRIIFTLTDEVKKMLLEITQSTNDNIKYPLNLTSIYSKRIYYYLNRFKDTGWRKDNLEQLRLKLNCPESYKKYSIFKIKVLDVAMKEINAKSNISFTYEPQMTGRKVTGISFKIYSVGNSRFQMN